MGRWSAFPLIGLCGYAALMGIVTALMKSGLLLASAPPAAVPESTCTTFVAPAPMSRLQRDDRLGESVDRFIVASPRIADPRVPIAIYAPETRCHTLTCNAERTTRREEAIRELVVARGIEFHRISLVGLREGTARFGDQPPGTVILIAGDPARPTCDAELRPRR